MPAVRVPTPDDAGKVVVAVLVALTLAVTKVEVAEDEVAGGITITGGAARVVPDTMSDIDIPEIFPALSRARTAI